MYVPPKNKAARVLLEVLATPGDEENSKVIAIFNERNGKFATTLRMMFTVSVGFRLTGAGAKGAVVHVVGVRESGVQTISLNELMAMQGITNSGGDEEDKAVVSEVKEEKSEEEEEGDNDNEEEEEADIAIAKATEKLKKKKETAPAKAKLESAITKKDKKDKKSVKVLKSGCEIQDVLVGTGKPVKFGRNVAVHYTLSLANGKVVDKSRKQAFKFRLGVGECIKGFDLGISGMREGGERHVVVPGNLGYGKQGAPPDIPPNAKLFFDVKVVKAF